MVLVTSARPERRARVNCIVRVGSASELNQFGLEMVKMRRVSASRPSPVRFQLDFIHSSIDYITSFYRLVLFQTAPGGLGDSTPT
jgi:hypothetical protein